MDAVINFFKEFSSMLPTIKVMDIVDILVVAFLIYKVIMMVRSTSAARIAKSVLIILILAGVTQLLNMYLLNYILDKILEIGLVALIVVFQPELRRMLEKLGSKNVREILSVKEEQREIDRVIEQTVQACEIMAKERTGVLIVFERSIPLLEYQKSGTVVDACVSSELLRNLFFTKASLHDGAVIIRNDRIAAAGCVLPLTENHNISSDLGTRHRAGIGISEVSDAVVVIGHDLCGDLRHAQAPSRPTDARKAPAQRAGPPARGEDTQPAQAPPPEAKGEQRCKKVRSLPFFWRSSSPSCSGSMPSRS